FLPNVREAPEHGAWRDEALRLEEVGVSAVGGRPVSDVDGEQKHLHQTLRAVDGAMARCCERGFDHRVDEIEASRHLCHVCAPQATDERGHLETAIAHAPKGMRLETSMKDQVVVREGEEIGWKATQAAPPSAPAV